MSFDIRTAASRPRAAASRGGRRGAPNGLFRTLTLLSLLALTSCITRTLEMPPPEAVPSPAGKTIEVASVADERAESKLGKVDSATIDSGPDLVTYVEAELVNSVSRLGFAVRQVERNAPLAGHKRVLASLLSAELSSESTLMYPVAAAVRMRIELIDEAAQSTFRKEVHGATSRELGFHKQGGPEDAQLLAEAIIQALSSMAGDRSFIFAVNVVSPGNAATRQDRVPKAAEQFEQSTRGSEREPAPESVANRLTALEHLLEEGLIDQHDYNEKRQEILDEL